MPRPFDVIVLGLGGMGSAAACHLAHRGCRVLGLEQFTPAHDRGSSHGHTRVIRQSYYEDPAYVPLLLRSYELWRELEQLSAQRLLFETGGLMIGHPRSSVVSGSIRSAQIHQLPHEILESSEIARRFPAFRPDPEDIALHEKRAGYLLPEKCVHAHLAGARTAGAHLHFEEPVLAWESRNNGNSVRVRTSKATYEAAQLVVCPGAWAPQILSTLGLPFAVERQVLYWIEPASGVAPFLSDRFPIFIWETPTGEQLYGFPAIDGPQGGVKVAFHRAPESVGCTPANIDRTVHEEEIAILRKGIAPLIPALTGRCIQATTCMYTNTPDMNFILGPRPELQNVIFAGGFSGHGFKFASVMGEVLADLVTTGSTTFDLRFLSPARFASQ